jgi:hypothetical protein
LMNIRESDRFFLYLFINSPGPPFLKYLNALIYAIKPESAT